MSTAQLDSDLYGDLYGDEGDTASTAAENTAQSSSPTTNSPTELSTMTSGTAPSSSVPTLASSSGLPAKPTSATTTSTTTATPTSDPPSGGLSYSAQIAQQFSSYHQTPSQERQQKKPSSALSISSLGASSDNIFGKKPSEMHDAGKLFIGGLNWDTTDEGLRDYMSQFGKVDALTIMRDSSGTSRGFAFMTFEDPNVLDTVLSKQHNLDGKLIDPKRAIPREEHLRNTRYFVGGLAGSTTPESMKAFFAAFGKVVDATVMMDRESNRSKGFGFVTFEDASQATTDAIVGKIGLILDEKEIEVKQAQPRTQRDGGRPTNPASSPNPGIVSTQMAHLHNGNANGGGNGNMMGVGMMGAPNMGGAGGGGGMVGNPQGLMGMPFMNPQQQQQQQMLRMGMNPMMGVGAAGPGATMMGAGGVGLGGGGMGMNPMMMAMATGGMGMNPMMNMGMMNGMGGMGMIGGAGAGGMGGMPLGGMGGMMNAMGGAGGMGRMGGMMGGGAAAGGGGGMLAAMQQQQRTGVVAAGVNRGNIGPSRTSQRGQHTFHPYSR